MQEQEVEVSFCDLCGTSVPAGDVDAQLAVLHQGKTIGGCCLNTLRGAVSATAIAASSMLDASKEASVPVSGGPVSASGGRDSSRMLTVALVMIIAFAGSVMFLENRLSSLENASIKASGAAAILQAADSVALQALSVKADGFADRADIAAIGLKQAELANAVATLADAGVQRQKILEQEVGGLRTQVNETMAKIVDYRPLFEDLRQRQTRALAAVEGLRSQVAAVPESPPPGPGPGPAISEPVIDLPPELADQVRKLSAADPAVRFEAVDELAVSKDLKVLPYMLPLAKDPDAFVRRLTVEGLREFRKPEAVDALLAALLDEDENVCDTAWRSLRDLTGQKFKFDASASKDARGRAAQAWQDWWVKARATFGK